MKKIIPLFIVLFSLLFACNTQQNPDYEIAGEQSKIIAEVIAAVNQKNAKKYVEGFADNVQVFVASEIKVNGKENLIKNRTQHFKNHPNVRSEIQHLVEIDNKVIMHDKVWLNKSDKVAQDIVEIFTFKNGKVIRVDVIQPNNLFQN